MKTHYGWAMVVVAALGVGAALWAKPAASPAPLPADSPVAQVQTQLAQERTLKDTVIAFGEVSTGALAGVSFQRAGQITRLSVLPGDHVARGTVLATMSLDPASREAYSQAVTTASAARREAVRLRQLLTLQLATQSQIDAATKAADDAGGNLRALEAQGGGTDSSSIAAPYDAVVTTVAVAQGDRVLAGAQVLQLARADALRVQIGVEPSDSRRVHVGTRVTLQPVTGPQSAASAVEARVTGVQAVVDAKTQLVSAIVSLPSAAAGQLVAGMKVRASLEVGSRNAIAVPRDAVLTDGHGDYVFQVRTGKAHRVDVKKEMESSGYAAIAGLKDLSSPVVVLGNYELQDGMSVREASR